MYLGGNRRWVPLIAIVLSCLCLGHAKFLMKLRNNIKDVAKGMHDNCRRGSRGRVQGVRTPS